jgi:signal transduction histidine kinase/DNA-binding response OmpR family regulator
MNEIELLNRMLEREKQARKAAETLMEQKSRELYEVNQGLRRLAEELTEARNLASQANEAKSSFLASMSHELRTPLNAIIGYSEILAEEAEDSGRQDMIADLKKICSAGKHLLALINDILDLSKIEAGKMDLYIESFEVASMIEEVVSTVAPLIEKNANVLELRCAEGLGTMRADLTKLRQAMFNLLSNASKFTVRGAITLSVSRERTDGVDWMSFSVKDSGIGMSPEQMGKLFQAFSQAEVSTSKTYGGTGLGLVLSRRICQRMGGDVTAESAPGAGSTFTIRLPAEVADPKLRSASPADGTAASAVAPGLPTVLVIDDDSVVHDLMHRFLDKLGLHMVGAASGEEGLRLAKLIRPALITLDVTMPGLDGWAVLTALKADPELAPIPVIMATGSEDKNMGFAFGAADYLTKPINRERLSQMLQKFVYARLACPVLVVEDDPALRVLMRGMLEKEGCVVAEAENGRVALERVGENRPELILLDLMMPEMDGFTFIEALRQNEVWRAIPVVVVTAKDLTAEDRGRLNNRVRHVLQKGSYSRDELLQRMHEQIVTCLRKTV